MEEEKLFISSIFQPPIQWALSQQLQGLELQGDHLPPTNTEVKKM
jgi:hypothetical protein